MTQIVETRPAAETLPAGCRQERFDQPAARTPKPPETVSTEETLPFAAPPPAPWPRIFPGL